MDYFLPTRIYSEIPLCVWRANYFSVTYTNSMIFTPSVSFDFGLSFCFVSTKERYLLLSIPFSLRISLASKPSQNGEIQVQWEPVSQKLKWITPEVETQPILLASTCVHIDTSICTCIGTHSANLHPQNFKTLKDEPWHRMVCMCVYLHKHTTLLICSLSRGFLRSSQVFAAVNSIVLNMLSHVCWYVYKITPVSAITGFSTIHYFPGW